MKKADIAAMQQRTAPELWQGYKPDWTFIEIELSLAASRLGLRPPYNPEALECLRLAQLAMEQPKEVA